MGRVLYECSGYRVSAALLIPVIMVIIGIVIYKHPELSIKSSDDEDRDSNQLLLVP